MKLLFIFFLLPLKLFAQDIAGVWVGTIYNDTTKQYIKYEMAISEAKGKLSGYSYTIFIIDGVQNIGVKSIKIKKSGDVYFVEDDKLIDNNYSMPPPKGVKTFSQLRLFENDTAMILKGLFNTNRTRIYSRLTGYIILQKKKEIWKTLIIPKLSILGLTNTLSFMPAPSNGDEIATTNKPPEGTSSSKIEKVNVAKDTPSKLIGTPGATVQKDNDVDSVITKSLERPARENKAVSQVTQNVPPKTKVNDKPNEVVVNKKVPLQKTKNDSSTSSNAIAPNAPRAAAGIATRQIETIRSVNIKSDSLLLTLYDNGEVDGDTVSVLLNGKVIMPLEGLSTKPINKTVYITPDMGDSIVLIMYAENLGSIPPNTGLLVVHDGEEVYYISFSGDLKKNAAIILRRKKKA
jgi:hypothetical protein